MTPSSPPRGSRRWPLRTALALVAVVLVATGVAVSRPPGHGSPRAILRAPTTTVPTTTSPVTTTSSGVTSRTVVTSTTVPPVSGPATSPSNVVSTALTLDEPSRGCGFVMASPSVRAPSPSSRSTVPATTVPATTVPATTVPATTVPATTVPTAAPRPVPVRDVGHCTVLEIGDSLGNDLGWGLARELGRGRGVALVQADRSSTGLVTTWYYDWPRHLAALLARVHPDLTIVCLGGNDEQGLTSNGTTYAFATPGWRHAYQSRVRVIDLLATRARSYVLWVGLPIMEPYGYSQGAAILNSIYRSVAGTVAGVSYLSTWRLFADAAGQYRATAPVNHVVTALRSPDGIHFTLAGEDVFATDVARVVAEVYHVRLALSGPAIITGGG